MALITTLTLEADGTVSIPCKNSRNGKASTYTVIAYGDFGGGTVTAQVSADAGVTYVDKINSGESVTFTEGFGEEFRINSDESAPVLLGFTLAGATAPTITFKVFDGK